MDRIMSNIQQYRLTNFNLVKQFVSFSAATSGVVAANYPPFLMSAIYYINAYVFADLFFAKRDMILHHLLVLSFFAAINIHEYPDDYKTDFMRQLVRVEYSTVLYSGGPIILHYLSSHKNPQVIRWIPTVRNTLHVAFAILFVKYRIHDFSRRIIFRAETYSPHNFNGVVAGAHLILTTWGFYALNLYWLQLIIMKLFTEKNKIQGISNVSNPPLNLSILAE
jgi:hypothetical protein